MSSNRYVNVTPRTPGPNLGLPSNRILLTNPETGNVVQRIAAPRDEKWVFNTKTKRFNLIPKNKNAPKKPVRRNVRIEDGHLVIEAHREDYEGASYTSGRVHSQGKADFLYFQEFL